MSNSILNDSLATNPMFPYNRTPIDTTGVIQNPNGRSWAFRNSIHDLITFDVNLYMYTESERDDVKDFYDQHYGSYDSFLWQDVAHYAVARQTIGTGDGSETDFQLIETIGTEEFDRYNIIDASQSVWVNDVAQDEGAGDDYTLDDTDSGMVIFNAGSIPGNTHAVEASFQYYRRCRFLSYRESYSSNDLVDIILKFAEIVPEI